MTENFERKIFLNIRATLEGCPLITNAETSADGDFYSIACNMCNYGRFAFFVRKKTMCALLKGSVRTTGIDDNSLKNLCESLIEEHPVITYRININKVLFQEMIMMTKENFEESNRFAFEKTAQFIEIISTLCRKLGMGNTIMLNYKDYVKPTNKLPKPGEEKDAEDKTEITVLNIPPDTQIPKESIVRAEKEKEQQFLNENRIDDYSPDAGIEAKNFQDADDEKKECKDMEDIPDISMEMVGVVNVNDFSESTDELNDALAGRLISVSEFEDENSLEDMDAEDEQPVTFSDSMLDEYNFTESSMPELEESVYTGIISDDEDDEETGGIKTDENNQQETQSEKFQKNETDISSEPYIDNKRDKKVGENIPKNSHSDLGNKKERKGNMEDNNYTEEAALAEAISTMESITSEPQRDNRRQMGERQERQNTAWKKKDKESEQKEAKNKKESETEADSGKNKTAPDLKKDKKPEEKSEKADTPEKKVYKSQETGSQESGKKYVAKGRNQDTERNNRKNSVTPKKYSNKNEASDSSDRSENKKEDTKKPETGAQKTFKSSIFEDYEKDLKNLESKYQKQIESFSVDDLLKIIENRYVPTDAGNKETAPDYIREKLCQTAKEELKSRIQ